MGKRRIAKRPLPEANAKTPNSISCSLCEKLFKDEHKLKIHVRSHTGETPFACDHCDKSFAQKAALKVHMRTHTGERPYVCEVCSKRFTRADHLHQHVRTHTGEKPYACSECDKSFATWSAISRHRAEHIPRNTYQCTLCEKAFSRVDNFRSHLMRRHRLPLEHSSIPPLKKTKGGVNGTNKANTQAIQTIKQEEEEHSFGPHFLAGVVEEQDHN